jgi:hypothetical protein
MGTYVRMMGLGPYRPINDLERALDRGEFRMAVAAAKDCEREYRRPIPLKLALRFLPLVAADPGSYDAYACRWLSRWLREAPGATIDEAAELAGALAELPAEPSALDAILGMLSQ